MTPNVSARRVELGTAAGPVSAALDEPASFFAFLVLAPGASGGMDGQLMSTVAPALAGRGVYVCRFNFRYVEAGRRSPDPQPVLERTYRDVVEELRPESAGAPFFLGGKSMGGRIASHIVAAGVPADGLVFLGYPLHPPGKPERRREQHLAAIDVPMLFVEGTRDPFCPLETLEEARARLNTATTVAVIEDGDHSFRVRKASGRATPEAWVEVADAVAGWLRLHAGPVRTGIDETDAR